MVDSRRKGHDFERDIVRQVREAMPGAEVERGLQYRDGEGVADCRMPVFHLECKVGKQQSPRAALAQATRDAERGKVPLAVVKDDRKEPFIVMGWPDFVEFLREWWARRDK